MVTALSMSVISTSTTQQKPFKLTSARVQRPNVPSTSQASKTVPEPTNQEIFKWTLTSEAIATCFVRDVLSSRANGGSDADFFWLGRVPCRTVRIVGLVVGVQVYEKRIVYTVDDGTSVIDCLHRQAVPPPSPEKHGRPASSKVDHPPLLLLDFPKPIALVGSAVRVFGKIIIKHDTRQIKVDQIDLCTSPNDEPTHWKHVVSLHESMYSGSDPFVLPAVTQSTSPSVIPPHEPVVQHNSPADIPGDRPQTPPTRCSTPSTSTVSSPARSISTPKSPPKLRHPSRLHSRDLTSNTFRIYLKHFMDNAPSDETMILPFITTSECDPHTKTTKTLSHMPFNDPTTPTKWPRHSYLPANDLTPQPSRHPTRLLDKTLSQLRCREDCAESQATTMQGFTISYLRRVPELAEMARRVVKAEKKRRALEEQKRVQDKGKAADSKIESTHRPEQAKGCSREPIAPKMKRLFRWAILQLYEEGGIIIWDGPVRQLPEKGCGGCNNKIWKLNSSKVNAGPDNSAISTISSVSNSKRRQVMDPDEEVGELSDPEPNEEAYIPLTAALLATEVEKAIGAIMARPVEYSRRRPKGICSRGPPPGPTKDEILTFLKRTDERWARVGEWAVDEALEVLKREERAWSIGRGRWELCI